MTIGTFLDISTCFITEEDNDRLQFTELLLDDFNFPRRVIGYAEGYFINCCELSELDDVCDELLECGMSQEFVNVYRFAVVQGIWYIRFDADGDDHYDFPKFAW